MGVGIFFIRLEKIKRRVFFAAPPRERDPPPTFFFWLEVLLKRLLCNPDTPQCTDARLLRALGPEKKNPPLMQWVSHILCPPPPPSSLFPAPNPSYLVRCGVCVGGAMGNGEKREEVVSKDGGWGKRRRHRWLSRNGGGREKKKVFSLAFSPLPPSPAPLSQIGVGGRDPSSREKLARTTILAPPGLTTPEWGSPPFAGPIYLCISFPISRSLPPREKAF